MAEPDNLALVHPRCVDEEVGRLADDGRDLKARVTGAEENLACVLRRLDLADAPY